MIITIDGPAGAGKSTAAKAVAERLGYRRVDTGAMYRLLALLDMLGWELNAPINPDDIRSREVSDRASKLAALPEVRAFLTERQREIARRGDAVFDGRDMGTAVLPDADVKIFLTAKPEIRARRRFDELTAKGVKADCEEILREINERDERDSTRATAPLKRAEDAYELDASELSAEETADKITEIVKHVL